MVQGLTCRGGCGTVIILFSDKNCWTTNEVWAGALSDAAANLLEFSNEPLT